MKQLWLLLLLFGYLLVCCLASEEYWNSVDTQDQELKSIVHSMKDDISIGLNTLGMDGEFWNQNDFYENIKSAALQYSMYDGSAIYNITIPVIIQNIGINQATGEEIYTNYYYNCTALVHVPRCHTSGDDLRDLLCVHIKQDEMLSLDGQ